VHLKSLTLAGFKSFADRTRIECEPGVTVVVGPNGTGKSNIVDALAWVMGTQATTSLRTEQMADVIFAGTATRRALGRSEVTLTLETEGDELGPGLTTVTIGRRLFRDGTSEYEINGTACRLLDIQELLADAGVGRHQHVIIGQGRVDSILTAGPDEHRAVIEEAAGVVKHRRRRDRAIRRLESTEDDVARLRDLLGEQQRRMKPLKRQARAAERHDELKADWHSLRLWIGGEALRTVRARRAEVAAGEEQARERLEKARTERSALDASMPGLQAAAGDAGAALERDTAAAARLETAIERLHGIALLARERRMGLERTVSGARDRTTALTRERDDLRARIEAAAREETEATEAAKRHEATLRALEDEERSLAEQVSLPAEGLAAAIRGDLSALESAAIRDESEAADLRNRRDAVAAIAAEEESECERIEHEAAAARAGLAEAQAARERSRDRTARDRTASEAAAAAHREAEMVSAAAKARLATLREMRANITDPVARDRARTQSEVVGTVAARLDVPADLASAIAAALGPFADALVAADGEALVAATGTARDAGLGGVAFVAARGDGGVPARTAGEALLDRLGSGADPALAAALLGDVVLAADWREAWGVVGEHPELRAVTAEGDLVTARGIRTAVVGDPPTVAEAAREAEEAATEEARASSRANAARRTLDASEAEERSAASVVESFEARLSGCTETIALLERTLAGHRAELERISARLGALSEGSAARTSRIARLRSRLGDEEGGVDTGTLEQLQQRRTEVAAQRDEAARRREHAAGVSAGAAERLTLLRTRLSEVQGLLDATEPEAEDGAVARLAAIEQTAERTLVAVRRHAATLRERERELRTEAGEAGTRLGEARERRDRLGEAIEAARESLSAFSVESAELAVREESIAEGLRRDVDASEEDALAAPRPEIPDGVEDLDAHLDTLAARLRRLGPINPLAAAEYKELKERAEFLEGQLADLDESRAELRKVISALDEEIARLFTQAFDDVSGLFAENIALLFPGGTGRLTLLDPEDPLEGGIEIEAQPMGKKVSRLNLLSGGERSLAALAFLFAVFRARPSPFYVLDEVEAALDDANLHRFLRLVATMRDTSQLVIVTHQQQTMEAADVLYGVTMEPGESSQVVSRRMASV